MNAPETAEARYHCGLCGLRFEEPAESHCASCALHRDSCGLVRCPRCGYEFPVGSRLVDWFRRRLRRSS